MRANIKERCAQGLLQQNEMETDEIDQDIYDGIRSAASQVTKSLLIDPFCKGLVEEINKVQNDISGAAEQISNLSAKVTLSMVNYKLIIYPKL